MSSPSQTASAVGTSTTATDWSMKLVLTLALAMGVSTISQNGIASLAPYITEDLGLSRVQFGALSTTKFLMGGLLGPFLGRVVDSVGGRISLFALFGLTAVLLVGMGFAGNYWILMGVLAVTAVPMALGTIATNDIVAHSIPLHRRGWTLGINQSGNQAGAFVAGFLMPVIAAAAGWRTAVVAFSAFACLGVVAVWRYVPATPASNAKPSWKVRRTQRVEPLVLWLAAYGGLAVAGVAATMAYLPLYAFEEVGLTAVQAGSVAGIVGLSGIVGRLFWGRSSDFLAYRPSLIAVALLSMSAIGTVRWAADVGPGLLLVGAVLFGLTGGAWMVVALSAIIRHGSAAGTGRATEVMKLPAALGATASPVSFGAVVDAHGYSLGWLLVIGLFGSAVLVMVVMRIREAGGRA